MIKLYASALNSVCEMTNFRNYDYIFVMKQIDTNNASLTGCAF